MTESMTWRSTSTPPPLADFDPYTAKFRDDPYPVYRRILGMGGPVYWDYLESYIVSSYADATAVLADPTLRVEPPLEVAEAMAAMVPEPLASMQRTVLFRDPPEHGRLRGLTRRGFAVTAVEKAVAEARESLLRILARAREQGGLEAVADLAFPVSLQVIGDLLGLPRADLPTLRDWGQEMSPAADIPPAPGAVEAAAQACQAFDEYFARLARLRRHPPGDGLFPALMRAQADGTITRSQAHASATLLFIAGHETLTAFMANSILTLLRHPDQLALLRRRPELAANAVDEVLRYESPLQLATAGGGRWTTADTEIGGRVIPARRRLLTLIGSANRDPAVYPDPDRFDIARPGIRHLALGHGPHHCLGSVLVRLEGEMLLRTLAGWPVHLEPTRDKPHWLPLFIQRRMAALPLQVVPR